jgi:DivIVA domain-containing protein
MWFFVGCAVVAGALTVGLVVARVDGGLGRPTSGLAHVPLPPGRDLTAQDVSDLRFDVALRGYRMEQVDDVLDRLHAELAALRQALEPEAPEPVALEPPTQESATPEPVVDPAGGAEGAH